MKKFIIWAIIILLSGLTIFTLFSNKKKAEDKIYKFDGDRKVAVTTYEVTYEVFSTENFYTGTFEPNKDSKLMFELPGKIVKLNYEVGEYVSVGNTISSLDIELLKLQKEQAEIQLASIENDFERQKILLEEKAVQLVQFEKIETAYKTAKIQLRTLNEQINKSLLKAPFSGIIAMKFAEIGTVVAPQMPVVQLSDIHKLRLTVQVSENGIKHFKINDKISVKTELSSEKVYEGKIVVISGKSDLTHNFMVQIEVNNTNQEIKAGTFGYVLEQNNSLEKQLVIPSSAVIGSSILPQVYIVENGKAVIKKIEILDKSKDYVAIKSGLNEGDIVITSGFINLSNGKNIAVKNNTKGK
ncbi:MAG: efflux RND transporter periplasmic adaptor subunit [Candidatus Kapabacteria bacterium]|nr:efflux RND transporter periplasmic adaptor subunit [Candidatus Kapabacteria bacterium]